MRTILIQLDSDPQPSVFDRVVAIDAGVDDVFSYGGVRPEEVEALVHGAIFTRGAGDLNSTAIFVGGSDAVQGERLLNAVRKAFFGPLRVSVMIDSNGCNTTAAAAVLAASQHVELDTCHALVLGATGPVGQRTVQLLFDAGAHVRVASRSQAKAESLCHRLGSGSQATRLKPCQTTTAHEVAAAGKEVQLIVAAGAAGVELLSSETLPQIASATVLIDLNAVPPAGIAAVKATDRGVERDGRVCYGALGVGSWKTRIHKAALRRLFETNNLILDTQAIYTQIALREALV